jgi:hypothetical protein
METILNKPFLDSCKLIDVLNVLSTKTPKIWDFYDMCPIFEYFNINQYDLDADKFNNEAKFTYVSLYDNSHHSDEESFVHVLYFETKPIIIIRKSGDRSDHDIQFIGSKSKSKTRDYINSLYEFNDINTNDIIDLYSEVDFSDHYTSVIIDKANYETYSYIKSPRWSFKFNKNMENLFYIEKEENETLTLKSAEFIEYVTDVQSWKETDEDKFMFLKVDGKKITVPFYRILVKNI